MRNNKLWKITLSLFLLVFLGMPITSLGQGGIDESPISASLVRTELTKIKKYSDDFRLLVGNCESLKDTTRPNGQKLKQCLTTLKGLKDRFTEFHESTKGIIEKIKRANKWIKELDEDFERNSSRRGVSSEIINEVKKAGGFRQDFQNNVRDANSILSDINLAIQEMEEELKNTASANTTAFNEPVVARHWMNRLGRAVGKIKRIVQALCGALPDCS